MLTTISLFATLQTGTYLSPGIPDQYRADLTRLGSTIRKSISKYDLGFLESVNGTDQNSIPKGFQEFADKYCMTVLGVLPKSKWRGYLNPIDYKSSNKGEKFMIATAYNMISINGRQIAIHFSNLGASIMIFGSGIRLDDPSNIRTEGLIEILETFTTFKQDKNKYEIVGDPTGRKVGDMVWVTLLHNFQGQGLKSPFPNQWWHDISCYTTSKMTIVRTNGGSWNNKVFKPSGLEPLFRKPDTKLSPLDEAFWRN